MEYAVKVVGRLSHRKHTYYPKVFRVVSSAGRAKQILVGMYDGYTSGMIFDTELAAAEYGQMIADGHALADRMGSSIGN